MAIDYLSEVKPLQDAGVSNADIATHLNARTLGSMQSQASIYVLQDTGAVLIDPVTGNKFGSFITYYESLPDGDAKNLIAFALDRWYSGQDVSTDEYPRSVQFDSVCATLPADLQAVCDQLVAEAGGKVHSGVTEADVVASQDDWEAAEAAAAEAAEAERVLAEQMAALELQYQTLYNTHIAPLLDNQETDSAVWGSALQTMANEWS